MLADSDFSVPALQIVDDALLRSHDVRLRLLRLDQIHPLITGNKWYKLKHNILAARAQSQPTVLSFGGAYSNHLVALAAACRASGLRSIGVIRGEAPQVFNPALQFAAAQGMTLHFVSREDYRKKNEADFLEALGRQFGPCFIVPEGGSNLAGIRGCAEIVEHLSWEGTTGKRLVMMACGTAASLTGVLSALPAHTEIIGVSVLKGDNTLSSQVSAWLAQLGCIPAAQWSIKTQYHHGGYAKTNPDLNQFIDDFAHRTGIRLEPVYTGKMMWAFYQMLESGQIEQGSEIIALHTGGMIP